MLIFPLYTVDVSNIPEGLVTDLSNIVSANDSDQSSTLTKYGDSSGHQSTLGE